VLAEASGDEAAAREYFREAAFAFARERAAAPGTAAEH
jgi:hypothetical protein